MLHFETEKQLEGFDGVISSIHEIANEDIASLVDFPTYFRSRSTCPEQFEKIIELPMNVSADGDGCGDWLHIRLFQENLLHFLAD